MSDINSPIKLSYPFEVDVNHMWLALTDLTAMRKWFFAEIPDFKAEEGFEITFDIQGKSRVFPHHWLIMEVVPLSKIVYNWNYIGYDGDSYLTFELEKSDIGCTIHLTIKIIEDFDDRIPEFKRDSWIGGWNYFMDRLNQHLIPN